jgi:hypothetical protein
MILLSSFLLLVAGITVIVCIPTVAGIFVVAWRPDAGLSAIADVLVKPMVLLAFLLFLSNMLLLAVLLLLAFLLLTVFLLLLVSQLILVSPF